VSSWVETPNLGLARRRLLALMGLGVAATLSACGKKGALRLPEPPPAESESSDEETR
jgi:predicted small lipoprotein YifL